VNLLLGRLAPKQFGFPVHIDKARAALQALKDKLPLEQQTTDELLLSGFLALANEKMAEAIRKISIKKGFDAADYALLAFGGAGGQHACGIAEQLGITSIVAPFHAGLLSAEGMGLARLERFAAKQVLLDLNACLDDLPNWINELEKEVLEALDNTPGKEECFIEERNVFLRLKGQESTLALDYDTGENLALRFREKYTQLYKHWPQDAKMEVESIRVLARKGHIALSSLRTEEENFTATAVDYLNTFNQSTPVFDWAALGEGATITGPALVVSPYATFFVDSHWQVTVQKEQCLAVNRITSNASVSETTDATTRLSLFTHRFQALAEDMGALLERTAFSVNVKERLDFSCALLDKDGYLIANAPHIPVHLGSLGVCLREVLKEFSLGPGDVIVTNHPAYGGSHLPDVTMMCGAFDEAGDCIGYLINRAHHAEIGGRYPGSMPADASTLEEEGVIIPPVYVMRGDTTDWTAIKDLLSNAAFPTRSLVDNLADLSAALASLQSGKIALESMAKRYGKESLHYYMDAIRMQTAKKLKKKLGKYQSQLPLRARQYLDDGAAICVEIREGSSKPWCFDFSGSAGVHPGNFNATEAIVHSVILYVLRLLVNEPIPLNEGLMNEVEVILPAGMLNPPFRELEQMPAVVGGNTELSQRITDTLLLAFGMAACSQGTMNNLLFGNEHFGFYETIAGGTGAGKGFAGASGVHPHMTNTRITDPEVMEFRYPIRLEAFSIREDSGGDGQYPGGNGLIRKIRFLEPVVVTMLSQHRKELPYGLAGGHEGAAGEQFLHLPDEQSPHRLPGCFSRKVPKGTLLSIFTPGGGGYGETVSKD
jgi:5-oxoprolinase (ATP-hydrolysing)